MLLELFATNHKNRLQASKAAKISHLAPDDTLASFTPQSKVAKLLTAPGIMLSPYARQILKEILHSLGYE